MKTDIDTFITNACHETTVTGSAAVHAAQAFRTIHSEEAVSAPSTHASRLQIALIITALCILLCGTAFATGGFGLINVSNPKPYVAEISFDSELSADDSGAADGLFPAKRVPDYEIKIDSLPKGFKVEEQDGYYAFIETDAPNRAIIINSYYLDSPVNFSTNNITGSEHVSVRGREGVLLSSEIPSPQAHDTADSYIATSDRTLFLLFDQEGWVVRLQASDCSENELLLVADAVTLTYSGKYANISELPTWTMFASTVEWIEWQTAKNIEKEREKERQARSAVVELTNLHAIGDTFLVPTMGFSMNGVAGVEDYLPGVELEYTVKYALAFENIGPYADRDYPSSWRSVMDDSNNFTTDMLTYQRYGDGEESVSLTLATETVDVVLVDVCIAITNPTDSTHNGIPIVGMILLATESEDGWTVFDRASTVKGADTVASGVTYSESMPFASAHFVEGEALKPSLETRITQIKPHETVTVHLGWLMNKDDLDKMLLAVEPGGDSKGGFYAEALEVGYVDIRIPQ